MSGPVMANSIAFEFRLVYQLPGMNSQSVMEAVAELEKDLPRVEEVGAPEGEAVVEQHAAVGNVDGLQVGGESFAETFAERKIEGSVRLQMIAGDTLITVGESRSVGDVC